VKNSNECHTIRKVHFALCLFSSRTVAAPNSCARTNKNVFSLQYLSSWQKSIFGYKL